MEVSDEKIDLPDGEYDALWSAYHMKIMPKPIEIKTKIGVRGINCKTKVIIKDNKIVDYE